MAEMPELGGLCQFTSPRAAGVRVWSIKGFENHLVFYRIVNENVEIVRMLHAARNIAEIFE
ncbi:MAG: type II toxin-antitoxin system RelE/ParE family toxin [Pirellulales bacterium]